MSHQLFAYFTVLLSLLIFIHGQDCNICGDGNSIQFDTGVVEFMYNGAKWKNSCLEIQKTVKNVNAISDEFCRTELLRYTKDVCRCTTPNGDLLSDLPSPTTAPTPSSVIVKAPTPTIAQDCNICGDGNSIQFPAGVIEFRYNGTYWKLNCRSMQQAIKNVNAISDEFCRTELLQYTKDVCRCTTPDGYLLSDLPSPTVAPTPNSVFVKAPTPTVKSTSPTSVTTNNTSSTDPPITPLSTPSSTPSSDVLSELSGTPSFEPSSTLSSIPSSDRLSELSSKPSFDPTSSLSKTPSSYPSKERSSTPSLGPLGTQFSTPSSNTSSEPSSTPTLNPLSMPSNTSSSITPLKNNTSSAITNKLSKGGTFWTVVGIIIAFNAM